MVTEINFDGIRQFLIVSGATELSVMELGAAVTSMKFGGEELVVGFDTAEKYLETGAFVGAIVGRFANRISGASFELGGTRYVLCVNEGGNTLHGGDDNLPWNKRVWNGRVVSQDAVEFTLGSPDGDNGFPGAVTAGVRYTVRDGGVRIDLFGVSDRDTYFAPTSHVYFSLGGRSVLDAELRIDSKQHLENGDGLIPTGRLLPNEGDFDFSRLRRIGRDLDDCFVLCSEDACTMRACGLEMELRTDMPALQVYTGKYLDCGLAPNAGLALEPEFFPDTPNRPEFPSAVLRAGERFEKYIELSFRKAE